MADYEEMLAASTPAAVTAHPTTHDTPLTIMYTSGTTGRPKGAVITQGMTFWNAVNCVEFYRLGVDMINLAFLPLFHTGGLNVFANPGFHFGGTTLVVRSFDPAECLRLLTDPDVGVTHFIGVPANYLFMSQVPAFEEASFPTIKAASVGGSPTPLPLIQTWESKGLPLQQAYGMTETSPLVLALKPEDCSVKIGSAGLPALHTEVRIVDDDGNDVPVGETGELWVRGPNITPGYWNRPDANEDSFTDGFLHTGDAARQDEDGFYYVVDRWKDMYISGGENVYPAEVESVIFELPEVAEVAVIGVPDEKWVEVGRALVVLKEGPRSTWTSSPPRSSTTAGPSWPATRCPSRSGSSTRSPTTPPARCSSGSCATPTASRSRAGRLSTPLPPLRPQIGAPMSAQSYATAVATARSVLEQVSADQMDQATPCASWNVAQLVDHLVGAQHFFLSGLTGQPPAGADAGYAGGDYLAAFDEVTAKAIEAFGQDGVMEQTFTLPFGEMPGAALAGLAATDTFQHGWDLAKATGQSTDLAPELAGALLAQSRASIQESFRGPEGAPFGAEQPCPDGAPVADQLAAFLGRSVA